MQQDGFSPFLRSISRRMVHIRHLVEGHRQSAGSPERGGGGVILLTHPTTWHPQGGHRDSSLACLNRKETESGQMTLYPE